MIKALDVEVEPLFELKHFAHGLSGFPYPPLVSLNARPLSLKRGKIDFPRLVARIKQRKVPGVLHRNVGAGRNAPRRGCVVIGKNVHVG